MLDRSKPVSIGALYYIACRVLEVTDRMMVDRVVVLMFTGVEQADGWEYLYDSSSGFIPYW